MSENNSSTYRSLHWKLTLVSHLPGIPAAYLLTGYFSSLYPGSFQFVLLSLVFQMVCGTVISLFLKGRPENTGAYLRNRWMSILALAVITALAISAVAISLQFPSLFDRRIIFMDTARLPLFAGLTIISIIGAVTLTGTMEKNGIAQAFSASPFFQFMQSNAAGILLSLLFFFTYFIFAQSLNFVGHRTLDQYFDTDISDWITRLTSRPQDEMPTIRAVHPAVMLILRSMAWLASVMLNGNKLQAVYFISALAGSACVFLVWLIVKGGTGNTTYALVMASILGAGTAHLLLSSMLETYIFSALALILFCFLMQSDRTSLKFTIPVGVLIFGITVSNLAQACILYFLKLPRMRVMIKFILAVVAVTLLLNVLQVNIFPNAEPAYDPSSLTVEENYRFNLSESSWRLTGRVNLISRAILLYGIVSPTPYILIEELGTNVPNFRTFQIANREFHVAGYKGLADMTVRLWIVILGLAFLLFIVSLVKSPRQMSFPISLILCLGFSLGLHVVYGDDPMLYSPNWAYALVLFVSSSLGKWADNKWLQLGLILFLALAVYTNLGLIHQIMEVSLPYYGK
jgi:hypothetical protein